MNRQRKVVITITYNEMGIIIDTKAEEVAQTEKRTEERTETHACDCISRQAAIDTVEFECGEWIGLARTIVKAIKQLPSAPERKTGEWEIYVISMLDGEGCRCSECGFEGAPYWDFCPNCGSYNGGEQE